MDIETNTNVSTDTSTDTGNEVTNAPEVTTTPDTEPEVKPEGEVKNNTENPDSIMIPKKRFDEVNTKYKELSSQVAEMQKLKEAMEAQINEMRVASEATKNSISEEKTKLEEQVKDYQTLVNSMVDEKIAGIPEDMRELIPEGLTVEQKLAWLNKADAKGLFKKQVQVEIGKPLNHSSEQDKAERIKKMNPLQLLTSYYGEK